jgi:uncharacterized protein YjbJ (UPF0337 family)
MNEDMIKGRWSKLSSRLKDKWGKLTDGDVNLLAGHREYLIGRLRDRYGIAREKAEVQVKEFERSLR